MEPDLTPPSVALINPADLTGDAPIVVLAPHPDDESLGCGALLAHAFRHAGAQVICMTDGSGSHPGSMDWPPARLAEERKLELMSAVGCLGGKPADVSCLDYPDGWLGAEDSAAVASRVAELCVGRKPRYLFAPAAEDDHEDHKATARIATLVAEALPKITVLSYPIWSRWNDPGLLSRMVCQAPVAVDPGPWRIAKRAAIEAHASQCGEIVHDDPDGFVMSPAFIDAFAGRPEIFWRSN